MKYTVNTKVIEAMRPCADRYKNWLKHYGKKEFTIEQFLDLEHITHPDKLWVVLRLVDRDTKIVFALDCSFDAYTCAAADAAADDGAYTYAAYATAYDAAYTVYAAAYDATAATAAIKAEQQRQIESLIYLIQAE